MINTEQANGMYSMKVKCWQSCKGFKTKFYECLPSITTGMSTWSTHNKHKQEVMRIYCSKNLTDLANNSRLLRRNIALFHLVKLICLHYMVTKHWKTVHIYDAFFHWHRKADKPHLSLSALFRCHTWCIVFHLAEVHKFFGVLIEWCGTFTYPQRAFLCGTLETLGWF